MTILSRRLGLIAAMVAVVMLVGVAVWAAVAPTRPTYYTMSVSGNSAGDATAVYGNVAGPAIIYLDSNNGGYGAVTDSRPTQASVVTTELFLEQDAATNVLTGKNLRGDAASEYRTYSISFEAGGTSATGSVTGYYSSTYGGTIAVSQPSPALATTTANLAAIFTGDTGLAPVAVRDTIVSFVGKDSVGHVFGKLIGKDSAAATSYWLRVIVFSDSEGYKSLVDTRLYAHNVTDSALKAVIGIDTGGWNRIYVEGRRYSDSAPLFMQRFGVFAAESRTLELSPYVQTTLKFDSVTLRPDTLVVDTGVFSETVTIALATMNSSRVANIANNPQLLRADSNAGLVIGETTAPAGPRRLTGTTRNYAFLNRNGVPTDPTSGKSITYTLDLSVLKLGISDTSHIYLGRYNPATMTWDRVSSVTVSADTYGILTAPIIQQGIYALIGAENAPAISGSGGGCVLNATVGQTGLSGILPALRSARDMVLGSSFGRLFVSGYYGIAALFVVAAFGLGASLVSNKR